MPIDPRINLQYEQPPNPLDTVTRFAQLQALGQENEYRQARLAELRRQGAREDAMLPFQQQQMQIEVAEHLQKLDDHKLEQVRQRNGMLGQYLSAVRNAPPEMKPQIYQQVHAQAIRDGLIQPGMAPEQYGPQAEALVNQTFDQAMTVQQQVENEWKKREDARQTATQQEIARHNLAEEGGQAATRKETARHNRAEEIKGTEEQRNFADFYKAYRGANNLPLNAATELQARQEYYKAKQPFAQAKLDLKDQDFIDKNYVKPANDKEQSYQMFMDAYRNRNNAKTGAESMLALSTHLATTFGNVKGSRVTKDMIEHHLGARGIGDSALVAVQKLTNGDVLSADQWDAFKDLISRSRKLGWDTAQKEADRRGVDIAPSLPADLSASGSTTAPTKEDPLGIR